MSTTQFFWSWSRIMSDWRLLVYAAIHLATFCLFGEALQIHFEAPLSRGNQSKDNSDQVEVTRVDTRAHATTYWSEKLAAQAVLHPTDDCYSACGSKSGYCDWCGKGNACCRFGLTDAAECSRSIGFTTTIYHECVGVGKESADKPTLSWHMLDRFILVPEHNLLFCYIEKVACTNFNDLFAGLRKRYDPNMTHTRKLEGWFQNDPYHRGYTKEDLERILVNRSWHKAIFYRDPVERFVSTYRSKCVGTDADGQQVCKESFGSNDASFPAAVQRIKYGETYGPEHEWALNVHLRRQSSFCGGLKNTLRYYNTVEMLQKETSHDKVTDLLHKVGADPAWIENFDQLFPPNTKAAAPSALQVEEQQNSYQHNTNTLEHLRDYFPRDHHESLDALVDHYKDDYKIFGLTPAHFEETNAVTFWRYQPENNYDVAPRIHPDVQSAMQHRVIRPGTVFRVSEELQGADGLLYLRLTDGGGWLFDRKPGVGAMCVRHEVGRGSQNASATPVHALPKQGHVHGSK